MAPARPARGMASAAALLAATALAGWPAAAQEGAGRTATGGVGASVGGGAAAESASPGLSTPFAGGGGAPGIPSSADRPNVRVGPFLSAPFATGLSRTGERGGPNARSYDYSAGMTLGTFYSNTSGGGQGGSRNELGLFATPFVRVTADTARVQGSFSFAPSFIANTQDTQPSRVTTSFFGTGTAEIIPGSVFVDARGAAFLQPLVPGATLGTTLPGTRSPALQQNYIFALSPYWVQRYGDLANSIVGYQLQYNAVPGSSVLFQPNGTTVNNNPGDTLGQNFYASLRSGERFGRLGMEARVNATFFSGGGPVNDGARNIIYAFDTRYAITRTVVLLGEIGYQQSRFGGFPGFRYDGITWGGGVRLDPSENSTIIAILRSRDGFVSPLVDLRTQLGPRTVVFGRYAEIVGNALGQGTALLNSVGVDAAGNPVSLATGAPQPQVGGSGFLGTTGGLSRNRIGTASITRFLQRDSLSLQYFYSERIPLSASQGQIPFRQTNNTVSATWSRPFTDFTSGFASVGYTWTLSTQLSVPSESFTASAGISQRFGRRLTGSLVYQFSHRTQGSFNPIGPLGSTLTSDQTQNTVLGSLSLQF